MGRLCASQALDPIGMHTAGGQLGVFARAGYAILFAAVVGMLALTWNLYKFAGANVACWWSSCSSLTPNHLHAQRCLWCSSA